jgi:hypothetical protein
MVPISALTAVTEWLLINAISAETVENGEK